MSRRRKRSKSTVADAGTVRRYDEGTTATRLDDEGLDAKKALLED